MREEQPTAISEELPAPSGSLWRELWSAIQGSEADYTKIDLKKAIFLLAVPMILELVMESTFAVVDIYFVGQLGASAVATVGLTETFLFLLYAIGMGFSMAVTAIIARRGRREKKKEEAGISAIQAIFLALLISLPFTIAGIFFSKELLTLMGADAWSMEHGYRYTQWMLGGNMVILLLFVINAIFRGAGDAAIAMADPMDIQRNQPHIRSPVDFWMGPGTCNGNRGGRHCNNNRPGHWRCFSILAVIQRRETHQNYP